MRLSLFSVSYAGLWGQHTPDVLDFSARAAGHLASGAAFPYPIVGNGRACPIP